MGRQENVEIFEDTKKLCESNTRLKEVIKKCIENQKLILENERVDMPTARYEEDAKIVVSKKRTYEAASAYKDEKVCVLNFASASNPGGGVVHGANAQEECLCRCSTLFFNLDIKEMWNKFYAPHRAQKNPLHNDDIIYTPDVMVFKSDTASPKLLAEKDWYGVNVITCAAPNLREKPSNSYNQGDGDERINLSDAELLSLHEQRLRKILQVASLNGNEVVILGAFGCGAFRNPPRIVAQAAKNVIKEFSKHFKTIEFAVYCSPKDDSNYVMFKKMFDI